MGLLDKYFKNKQQIALENRIAEPLPHNRYLWQDINQFFREIFEQQPGLRSVYRSAETLMHDLEARFKGRYNLEELRKMLDMGYRPKGDQYEFLRTDFILPKANS